jgi:hypothetical protein
MQHMLKPNVALCVGRAGQVVGNAAPWNVCWCSDSIEDFNFFYRGGNVNLPLYTYESAGAAATGSLLIDAAGNEKATRRSNLSPEAWKIITDFTDVSVLPEQLFAYVYAILCSPTYRERYADFLKSDFPRIPFTKDRDTFLKLADLGQQLIDLHLMRSPELDNPISRFCGKGDGAVTKVEYDGDRGRVSISPTQYFDGVTPDLWTYQIGGYQVLSKWLKDRRGRFLTSADTIHYSRIVTVVARTVDVQSQIDVTVKASELFVLQ